MPLHKANNGIENDGKNPNDGKRNTNVGDDVRSGWHCKQVCNLEDKIEEGSG